MKFFPKHYLAKKEVKKFIIIFNVVGLIGFLLPISRTLFIHLTPMALVLNIYLMLLYVSHYSQRTLLVFVLVYLFGFGIEVLGVNTGKIFGQYAYGEGLGIKLWNTPLLIGVNWLFLTYASMSLVSRLDWARALDYLIAPALMLVYDLVLEQVAPVLDMWSWEGDTIPLQNYIVWYILGVLFTLLLKWSKVPLKHSMVAWLVGAQFFFFVILMLVLQ